MAYQLISAPSNQEAIMTAVRDFAVANGYTNEGFVSSNPGVSRGAMTLSRGDLFVSFRWDGTDSGGSIAMYQSTGYTGAQLNAPWNHPGDSGNGDTDDNINTGRRIEEIGDGPYIALHLFYTATDAISGNSAPVVYCVLEYETGKFRHFGFGTIDKFGDGWTGGEWVGGHVWSNSQSRQSAPTSNGHSVLLDGYADDSSGGAGNNSVATMRVAGLPGITTEVWANVWDDNSPNNDSAGNPKVNVQGCVRGNAYTRIWGQFVPSNLNGFQDFIPMPLFYRRDISGSNQRIYLLGWMSNVRMLNMRNYEPGELITIGANQWRIFPIVSKANAGGNNEESENMGIAYLQVA